MEETERRTAEEYLLNPYSGEWIKAIKIAMAEPGLVPYSGKPLRKSSPAVDLQAYILARIAFVRCAVRRADCREVPLYRGMSSEQDLYETPESLPSVAFSPDTAAEFADIRPGAPSRSAYLVKFTPPVEMLFMTFFETEAFNQRYLEQEAVILYRK